MSGSSRAGERRALTPAVAAAAAFATLAALVSVAFVTARGGLQLPLAASAAPVAIASPIPSAGPSATPAPAAPTPSLGGPRPTALPGPGATRAPSPTPATPTGAADPLLALPACPDHPGCFVYSVRRGDSYTGVSDRFHVLLWIMDALNPEVTDTRVILVGHSLYLGRDPTVRLEPCPDGTCHLYTVRSGDTLSTIAGRYGLSVAGIKVLNPSLDPSSIVPGQVIRLPLFQAP